MLLSLGLTIGCSSQPRFRTNPPSPKPKPQEPQSPKQEKLKPTGKPYQIGLASYYAHKFHGRPTASGEIFDMNGMTAAHRTIALGTIVRVTHIGNGRSVVVKVNDRGPFVEDRILDLSLGAAKKLDMIGEGVAHVKIEILKGIE